MYVTVETTVLSIDTQGFDHSKHGIYTVLVLLTIRKNIIVFQQPGGTSGG